MSIQKVTISGIRSYSTTVNFDLDPKVNIVLGCNGSGKSNLYYAIQAFLDNHVYTGVKRCNLFSEGHDLTRIKAYVQLLFNNENQNIPVKDVLPEFRREFLDKNDHFLLAGKPIVHNEFNTYLSVAGYDLSNPFLYVCPTTYDEIIYMNDRQRMQSFRTALGLENKRMNLNLLRTKMQHIQNRLNVIGKRCSSIEKRRHEIVSQNQEFDSQMNLVKKRNLIRAALHSKTSKDMADKRQELNQQYQNLSFELNQIEAEIHNGKGDLSSFETELQTWDVMLKKSHEKIKGLEKRLDCKKATLIKLRKEGDRLHKLTEAFARQMKKLEDELQKLEDEVEKLNKTIAENENEQEKLRKEANDYLKLIQTLNGNGAEVENSYRKRFFQNEDEKRQYLKLIRNKYDQLKQTIERIGQQKFKLFMEMNEEQNLYEAKEKECSEIVKEDSSDSLHYYNLKCSYERRREEQTVLESREVAKLREMTFLKERVDTLIIKLTKRFHTGLIRGYLNLQQLFDHLNQIDENVQRELVTKYHGTVADNLVTDEILHSPLSSVLGKRIFSHIVEDTNTASQLVELFNRESFEGVLNFIPLKGLHRHKLQTRENDKLLLNMLKFEEHLRPAMEFLMNNVYLTSNFYGKFNFAGGVKFVTLDGTLRTSENSIYGGYQEESKNHLTLYFEFCELYNEYSKRKCDWTALQSEVGQNENKLAEMMCKLEGLKSAMKKRAEVISLLKKEIAAHKNKYKKFQNLHNEADQKLAKLSELESKIYNELQYHEQIEKGELVSESGEETTEPATLSSPTQLDRARASYEKVMEQLQRLIVAQSTKRLHLNKYVFPRKEEIEQSIEEIKKERDLMSAKKEHQQTCIDDFDSEIKEMTKKHIKYTQNLSPLNRNIANKKEELVKTKEMIDGLEAKKGLLQNNLETIEIKMKELDKFFVDMKSMELFLNDDEIEDYLAKSITQLNKELKQVERQIGTNESLSADLKQAVVGFQRRIAAIDFQLKNARDLESAFANLRQLVQRFHQKRKFFIQECLEKLINGFSEIFRRFVPSGSAALIIGPTVQNSQEGIISPEVVLDSFFSDSSQNTAEASNEQESIQDIETQEMFDEIQFRVNFDKDNEIPSNLFGLSGGQRTILALTYIMAFHNIFPSPIYLLDEVDAALNPSNRLLVTELVKELSESSQIILTTFNPELLTIGNKFFRINYVKKKVKTSSVNVISREEAEHFILNDLM